MHTVTLTADDGTQHVGKLPTNWANTPLAAYAALTTAELLPARVRALAALVGLPPEGLLHDVRHYAAMRRAAPWLFSGELPEGTGAIPKFKHQGVTYHHVGHLDRIAADQMEALFTFLAGAGGKPLTVAPSLLAVLYCPAGKTQTADVVQATAAAFATLPMSVAWPALGDFIRNSGPCATSILSASELSAQAANLLDNLEASLRPTAGGSRTSFLSLRRRLGLTWIRHVRKAL